MKKKTFFILFVVLIVIFAGAAFFYAQLKQRVDMNSLTVTDQQADEVEEEEQDAPDFTVYDENGKKLRFSDVIGKPVVLNFWASWCGPCRNEMPHFQEKYLEMGEDICFLMINVTDGSRETVDKASEFIREQKYAFPVFYDIESDAAGVYGIYSLPTTYFIDREGHLTAQAVGTIDEKVLQQGIDLIIDEK